MKARRVRRHTLLPIIIHHQEETALHRWWYSIPCSCIVSMLMEFATLFSICLSISYWNQRVSIHDILLTLLSLEIEESSIYQRMRAEADLLFLLSILCCLIECEWRNEIDPQSTFLAFLCNQNKETNKGHRALLWWNGRSLVWFLKDHEQCSTLLFLWFFRWMNCIENQWILEEVKCFQKTLLCSLHWYTPYTLFVQYSRRSIEKTIDLLDIHCRM